jgi:hypothetical protein
LVVPTVLSTLLRTPAADLGLSGLGPDVVLSAFHSDLTKVA